MSIPISSIAQEQERSVFIDTLDNSVVISKFLRTKHGFAFVLTLITDPAIGYGGGLIFIHRDPSEITHGKGNYPSILELDGFIPKQIRG